VVGVDTFIEKRVVYSVRIPCGTFPVEYSCRITFYSRLLARTWDYVPNSTKGKVVVPCAVASLLVSVPDSFSRATCRFLPVNDAVMTSESEGYTKVNGHCNRFVISSFRLAWAECIGPVEPDIEDKLDKTSHILWLNACIAWRCVGKAGRVVARC